MDDGSALLAAIALHPDEDVPRLAYADWLDEQGSHIRAEFIRVQCEINAIETHASADVRKYAALYFRQNELLTHSRRELLCPLGNDVTDAEMNIDIRFERGFLKELKLNAKRFVKHADSFAELKPRPDVAITDSGYVFEMFRSLPRATLDLVTSFEVHRPTVAEFGPVSFNLPAAEPILTRLNSLSLARCQIDYEQLEDLLSGVQFPALHQLDLSENLLFDEGVAIIVQSALWPRLTRLVLDDNVIGDEGAELLANAPPTAIQYLNVRRMGIGQRGQSLLLNRKGWNVALF